MDTIEDVYDYARGAYSAGYRDGWEDGRDPESANPVNDSTACSDGANNFFSTHPLPRHSPITGDEMDRAREIAARVCRDAGLVNAPHDIADGGQDDSVWVQIALAALRALAAPEQDAANRRAREALENQSRLIDDMSRFAGQLSLAEHQRFNDAPIEAANAIAELDRVAALARGEQS